jgi:hypothetical protein
MDYGRFGFGSMRLSWLWRELSDKIGFLESWFSVYSTSGILLFLVQHIRTFWDYVLVFVIMTVADMFRPAMFVFP